MNYQQLIHRVWNQNVPFSALIELTYRCNLDCFFCYNDVGLDGQALSTAQYFRLFEDLRDMGTMNLTLSGGEPLAHRDFFVLGEKARELGFVVRIKSNGHAISGKMARRIKERIDPYNIELSLHGARAETHDRQTRVHGSFDRLMRNIPEMLDLGLRVQLNSPLTAWNQDELDDLFAIADALGVRLNVATQITPRDNGDQDPMAIEATAQATERLSRILEARAATYRAAQASSPQSPSPQPLSPEPLSPEHNAKLPKAEAKAPSKVSTHCGSGSSGLVVDPYGTVYPCVQWRRTLGNLHRHSVQEIWTGSAQLEEVRRLNRKVKGVIDGLGPQGSALGFCPGMAEQITGSADKLYPYAERRLKGLQGE